MDYSYTQIIGKLEPEETLHRKLISGDGHCIANCFVVHFEEDLDKVLEKLNTNLVKIYKSIDNFLNAAPRK